MEQTKDIKDIKDNKDNKEKKQSMKMTELKLEKDSLGRHNYAISMIKSQEAEKKKSKNKITIKNNSIEKTKGRPEVYTEELADEFCNRLALGRSLATVCKDDDMPDARTIFKWMRLYPIFLKRYEKATQERTELLAEEIIDLSDKAEKDIVGDDKSDNARVQARKLQIDTRKWIMAKMKPQKYGDKIDISSNGEPIQQINFINALPVENKILDVDNTTKDNNSQ